MSTNPIQPDWQLIHEDPEFLVVAKPSGMLSVPGRLPENKDCLISRIQTSWPEARIVHRLDQETSGLMVVALNADSHRHLSRQFEQRKVQKKYIALIAGHPTHNTGTIDFPLITDWPNRPRQKICYESGKASCTHYQVTDQDNDTSRVELTPITGRSHQLRVHLLGLGHPILGDKLYAPPEIKARSPRLLLHASELCFYHPVTEATCAYVLPATF
ncbi:MAG: RluA family pseudouridine synthase [Hahellaceae bacterium]|nr:RluA family pseudouridine synthase [Hahellaceae bacterium]MCP5170531.1 RluA family pseudouridine synthase [Hahellaceae bacterium]